MPTGLSATMTGANKFQASKNRKKEREKEREKERKKEREKERKKERKKVQTNSRHRKVTKMQLLSKACGEVTNKFQG